MSYNYESFQVGELHPYRLGAIAKLKANLPFPSAPRILDLGCGQGNYLLNLALQMPEADLTGVDSSSAQIAKAKEKSDALKAKIEWIEADFEKFAETAKTFDLILCRGIYSWIPKARQKILLQALSQLLAPQGMMVIGHNIYPGWKMREIARDSLKNLSGDKFQKSAQWLEEQLKNLAPPLHRVLRAPLLYYQSAPHAHLLYDDFAEDLNPGYFSEFEEKLREVNLEYWADAQSLESSGLEHLKTEPRLKREILFDLLTLRPFRTSVVGKKESVELQNCDTKDLETLKVCAKVQSLEGGLFQARSGIRFQTQSEDLKERLETLSQEFPKALLASEVFKDIPWEAIEPLIAVGALELWSQAPAISTVFSERPKVSALALWQAARQEAVTNLRMETLVLSPELRSHLQLFNGENSLTKIEQALGANREVLEFVRREALLVG